MFEIRVPEIAKSEAKPYLGRWFKEEGDAITAGEPVVEIFTPSGRIEVEAPATGVLSDIRVRDGEYVQANSVLGIIGPKETEY
jgi:2-oxoglutarate dehydrogenase E2 component (dihydrolipoamide succinyltransferase)